MKIITLICNFVLLGIVILFIMENGLSKELELRLSVLIVLVVNIALILGRRINLDWQTIRDGLTQRKFIINKSSFYSFIKIIAVLLNMIFAGIAFSLIGTKYNSGGIYFLMFSILIVLTPLISLVMIIFGKENKAESFIRTIFLTGAGLFAVLTGFLIIIYSSISIDLKEHIRIAKGIYPGSAEDALIAYLSDTTRSAQDRSNVAVWTLGQIGSKKALPVLYKYYKNDPEGRLCKGRHDSMICQRELHKAIVKLENNGYTPYAKLNK